MSHENLSQAIKVTKMQCPQGTWAILIPVGTDYLYIDVDGKKVAHDNNVEDNDDTDKDTDDEDDEDNDDEDDESVNEKDDVIPIENLPIFLINSFNTLGKTPVDSSAYHQLPNHQNISERHCQIRSEKISDDTGVLTRVILEDISDAGTMVEGALKKWEKVEIDDYAKIAFGPYEYKFRLISQQHKSVFANVYDIGKRLGKGHFSTVRLVKDKVTGQRYAAKILNKYSTEEENKRQTQIQMVESEIKILTILNHENLITIHNYFNTPQKIYLVIDYIQDGDFHNFLTKERNYNITEEEIRLIFKQLFNAILYLHMLNIAHRDLKPENILMASKEDLKIKVSDFGLSKLLNVDYTIMQTKCGTPSYVAPEIFEQQSYNKAVDMWSSGVILYTCINGGLPFIGKDKDEILKQIKSNKYSRNSLRWQEGVVSVEACRLVDSLLNKDPDERLSANKALQHEFFMSKK